MTQDKVNYEFEVAGQKYSVEHRPGHVCIFDENDETLVLVYNYANLYDADKTFPLPMAQMVAVGYQQGIKDGISIGQGRAQHEMRQALGL